jgi:amidohydrolase
MNQSISRIKTLSLQYFDDIVSIRRHFHKNPELSFQEHNTARFISEKLTEWGITHSSGIAGTGIIANIQGENGKGGVVALRADMDALPIEEQSVKEYASSIPGVMHACGHDVHSASALGAIRILNDLKDTFSGTVRVIFQPGEEKLPGGASLMIKEGVLKNPEPAVIIGQHVMPFIESGKVGFRKGLYMASTDELYVTVKGRGGHGAMPHLNIDPVVIASHIIISLQQIVSRNANPAIPSVLSFGKVIANGATNVIPSEVHLEGTFRTFDEKWREDAHQKMIKMAMTIAESMGGSCEFKVVKGYPFLINNEELTTRAIQNAEEYLGKENVEEIGIWMAAEDFAFYSQIIPACFYRLGTGNKALGINSPVHTATFDIDESSLETGMGLMAWMTLCELNLSG